MDSTPIMQDVARKARVHVATVSRALRGRGGVSETVRARVCEIAASLGYQTNPLVSALIRSRRDPRRRHFQATLGLLKPSWPPGGHEFREDYRLMIEGARRRAAELGYQIDEFALPGDEMSVRRLDQVLAARSIVGMILPPLFEVRETIEVDRRQRPLVAIGFSLRVPVPRVVHDHVRAIRMALAKCREAGRQRVGLVLPRRVSEKVEGRWVAAYLMEQFQFLPSRCRLPPLLLEEAGQEAAFLAWTKRYNPDAIIGLQHLTPMYRWLRGRSRQGASQVALITLDRRELDPQFSGIDQNYALIGGLAVEQVVNLVERNDRTMMARATVLAVDGIWRDGTTSPLK